MASESVKHLSSRTSVQVHAEQYHNPEKFEGKMWSSNQAKVQEKPTVNVDPSQADLNSNLSRLSGRLENLYNAMIRVSNKDEGAQEQFDEIKEDVKSLLKQVESQSPDDGTIPDGRRNCCRFLDAIQEFSPSTDIVSKLELQKCPKFVKLAAQKIELNRPQEFRHKATDIENI